MPGERAPAPGWYVLTPAGLAGPHAFRADALAARPVGASWPIQRVNDCGCGGLCDPGEPCPMATGRTEPPAKPPCECGNPDADWRDYGTGLRRYLCNDCHTRCS